jgi:DNA-binding CsgD family transcriptional regulator
MGAKHPFLIQPRCPAVDDPEIGGFLRVAQTMGGFTWVELVLEPDGDGEVQSYRRGSSRGRPTAVQLRVGREFRASLRIPVTAKPSRELEELLSQNLTTILDCHTLRTQARLMNAVLDATSSAVLLFTVEGDIVYANPPADRLLSLQTEDELLAETNGQPRQPLFTLLCALVERTAVADHGGSSWKGTLNLVDGRVMTCEVTRVELASGNDPVAVLAFLQPIDVGSDARVDVVAASYGLSPRELEVLELLVQGLTTVAIAEELGISPHTVRDHLKHLYRKTRTSSRGELLGMISRPPSTPAAG